MRSLAMLGALVGLAALLAAGLFLGSGRVPGERLPDPPGPLQAMELATGKQNESKQPWEETLGSNDFVRGVPFEGPATGAAIGMESSGGSHLMSMGLSKTKRDGTAVKEAVSRALDWLRDRQAEDGAWDGDAGRTGLVLLAFLAGGQTHKHGEYRKTVRQGLRRLKIGQSKDGAFAEVRHAHAFAALAMTEAYALTASPLFKQSAQSAIDRISGWFAPDQIEGVHASLATWSFLALISAKKRGLRVGASWKPAVLGVFETSGWETETLPPATRPALTAAETWCRLLAGERFRKSERLRVGADFLRQNLPQWNVDPVYGLMGAFAMNHLSFNNLIRDEEREAWFAALQAGILPLVLKDGSWSPAGPHGDELGRTGTTALTAWCLFFPAGYRHFYRR